MVNILKKSTKKKIINKESVHKIRRFDLHYDIFNVWIKDYERQGRGAGWSDSDLIKQLIEHVDENLKLLLKTIPLNEHIDWQFYSKLVSKSFEKQKTVEDRLIEQFDKTYDYYNDFFDFITDKLSILAKFSYEPRVKKLIITNFFRNQKITNTSNYEQFTLNDFYLACCHLKRISFKCKHCPRKTHTACPFRKSSSSKLIQKLGVLVKIIGFISILLFIGLCFLIGYLVYFFKTFDFSTFLDF